MKVVVIAGIPGSGSTTVLSKALEELDYMHVNYGDVMLEIAKGDGLVDNRDDLRKLSPDIQKEVQENAAQSIREKSEQSNISLIHISEPTRRTPTSYAVF